MNIQLQKWYLDGVTPEGDVCIGYHAKLQWGPLSSNYRGLLVRGAQGQVQDRSAWSGGEAPKKQASGDWRWSEWMTGVWRPQGIGMTSVLWNAPGVGIHWNCIAPNCAVEVQTTCLGEILDWKMAGYMECMELSISTLSLPFRSLHWGRAIVGANSLVWISWDEGQTLSKVWLNGVEQNARLHGHGPQTITGLSWRLELEPHAVLRDRELGMVLPAPMRRRAGALAQSREIKWLGKAILTESGQEETTGWAIFEYVVWL